MTQTQEIKQRDKRGRFLPGNKVAVTHGLFSSEQFPPVSGIRRLNTELNRIKKLLKESDSNPAFVKALIIDLLATAKAIRHNLVNYLKRSEVINPKDASKGILNPQPAVSEVLSYIKFELNASKVLGTLEEKGKKGIQTPIEIIQEQEKGEENGKNRIS